MVTLYLNRVYQSIIIIHVYKNVCQEDESSCHSITNNNQGIKCTQW